MKKLSVDIWSDIACPWCYVGKRRFEAALARFPHGDAVEITWRAFELDPAAPRVQPEIPSYAERLAKKYGRSLKDAEAMLATMTTTGQAEGLSLRFDRVRPGNTFDAHRVLHLAHARGVQGAVKERLLRGYMTEGEAIGEAEVLVRLGAEAGLDADEVRAMLASDTYRHEVKEEESDAAELGISGVPFFVIGGRYAVSGAQPVEVLLRALEHAWKDVTSKPPRPLAEGAACSADGCG
jgi:predicted DsbA family dithiol-disulfide isomerase